ncbi:hypothetical protein F5Y11DRAFT_352080 [Daldinia sp. FL1419]|nr:hypothetical protein F5Y11DRAFT_352080 [Daldinia sp. FL1419]
MESFSLAAQHAGAINHVHTIRLDPTTAAAVRELRIIVTVVVAGWKGSPRRRPKITHPAAIPNNQLSQQATEALFQPPFLDPLFGERPRQRRISRKKNGVRVSRRLPSRETGESASCGKQYSLMQVSEFNEDHPYWGTLRESQIPKIKPKANTSIENKQTYGDPIQPPAVDNRNYSTKILEHTSRKTGGRRRRGMSITARNRGRTREKRFGLADPLVWDAINRSLSQQRQLSTLVIPEDAVVEHISSSEIPSRSSSQRKALDRFTRQLEKYADAAGAASKVPVVTPTDSDSKVSYRTVQPLLPYQKEFRAAGLAVTSAEQSRRPLVEHGDGKKPVSSSVKYAQASVQVDGEFERRNDAVSERSASSSGSYVEFTPAGNPIEVLPDHKPKSKSRLLSKNKGGILPWLKRKSPVKESHNSSRVEAQHVRPPANNSPVRRRVQNIDSQHTRYGHSSLSPGARPSGLRRAATTAAKPINSPTKVITPHESPGRKLSWVEAKRSDHGRHSGLLASRPNPEPQTMQPMPHTGQTGLRKRDVAMGRLPLPETIEEEKETPPSHVDQAKIQIYPHLGPTDAPVPVTKLSRCKRSVSPQTTPSTLPSLPSAARYAVSRASSLERALDEVSHQLEKLEQEADKSTQLCSHPPTLVDKTNQKHDVYHCHGRHTSGITPTRKPGRNERVIYVDRKMPPMKPPKSKLRKLSSPPPKPTRKPPTPPAKQLMPKPSKEKVLPAIPKTDDILKDLDVFFDYEDGGINDRDVIRGLQVAIHAAADNTYDAMIRAKTGLRIRRFLADLRAVGETQEEDAAGQSAKERLTMSTRLLQTQGGKSMQQVDS